MALFAIVGLILAADPSPDVIARAIRALGAPTYQEREAAMQALWSAGMAAEPALRAALASPDAEVVARARSLLERIPFGVTPDSPPQLVELIALARAGGPANFATVAPKLLDLGPRGLDVAEKLVVHLSADERVRLSLRGVLDRESWRIAPELIARGDEVRADKLLDRGARAGVLDPDMKAVRHYAAWLALRGHAAAGLAIVRERALAGDDAAVVGYWLARHVGDRAAARAFAERIGRDEHRETALYDAGAWAELAGLPPPGLDRLPVLFGLRVLYQRLAGQPYQAALDELKKLPRDDGDGSAPSAVFRALMFAGLPDDALALEKMHRLVRFELFSQQRRYPEALAALEPLPPIHSTLRWQCDAARLRVYHFFGQQAKYRELLEQMPRKLANGAEIAAVQQVVEALVAIGSADDARPFAAAALEYGGDPAGVLAKLYPRAPLAAEIWWHALRLRYPAESPGETVARLSTLLDRRLGESAGREQLTNALSLARTRAGSESARWLQGLAEACELASLPDDARSLMIEAAQGLDSAAGWIRLGDLLAGQRRYREAADAYDTASRKDERRALAPWLAGWARQRAGDANGRELCERAHRLMLADETARADFAEELIKRTALGPEIDEAVRRERKFLLALAAVSSDRARTAHGSLSADPLARTDRLEAADDCQRYLVRLLRTNSYFRRHDSYLSVLHRLQANRAAGLLAKGDINGAVQAAEAAQKLLPGSTSPAEWIVVELSARGKSAEAERVYRAPADTLDRLRAEYPDSAALANSRAWLSARCRRDLPQAIELARQATKLAPAVASFHETLAEAHLQSGDRPSARAAIEKAIEIEPSNRKYAEFKARLDV